VFFIFLPHLFSAAPLPWETSNSFNTYLTAAKIHQTGGKSGMKLYEMQEMQWRTNCGDYNATTDPVTLGLYRRRM